MVNRLGESSRKYSSGIRSRTSNLTTDFKHRTYVENGWLPACEVVR